MVSWNFLKEKKIGRFLDKTTEKEHPWALKLIFPPFLKNCLPTVPLEALIVRSGCEPKIGTDIRCQEIFYIIIETCVTTSIDRVLWNTIGTIYNRYTALQGSNVAALRVDYNFACQKTITSSPKKINCAPTCSPHWSSRKSRSCQVLITEVKYQSY